MKERLDHTLRAALDDCLSGTEEIPSQRESILQKTQENTRAFRLPRMGVIIALVLLLTIASGAVAGTFNGMINWRGEPDDSAVPTVTPQTIYGTDPLPQTIHTALTHLKPEDDQYARRVFYRDENGHEHAVHGAIQYSVASLEELRQLFADSALMLPQGLHWPVDDHTVCYANVSVKCLNNGTYEKVGEKTFDDGMVLELYQPEEGAKLVSSLDFSGWTEDKWQVRWTARYQRNSDSLGFELKTNQQIQHLDIPGMTDAIAVTEANKTTIYMRQTLPEPVEYITFSSMFIAEEKRTSPHVYDEIYYEISGIAQSVEDLLALLPQ